MEDHATGRAIAGRYGLRAELQIEGSFWRAVGYQSAPHPAIGQLKVFARDCGRGPKDFWTAALVCSAVRRAYTGDNRLRHPPSAPHATERLWVRWRIPKSERGPCRPVVCAA